MPETTRFEIEDDVAVVTVDRPKAMNALNEQVLADLEAGLEEAEDQGARALVVTGAGEKAFVAGADIGAMVEMDPSEARAFSRAGHAVLDRFESSDVATIAAVNGFALGGGLELALTCDLRVASERAQFGVPEVTLGVVPGFGGTQRLTRVCGLGPGLDLLLTGRRIDAKEARRLGLVTHVTDHDETLERARELAGSIASNGPVAVSLAKRTARRGADASLATGDGLETEAFAACFGTEDQEEGMRAFLDKREAEFQGR